MLVYNISKKSQGEKGRRMEAGEMEKGRGGGARRWGRWREHTRIHLIHYCLLQLSLIDGHLELFSKSKQLLNCLLLKVFFSQHCRCLMEVSD